MSKRQRLFQPGTRGLDTNLLVVLIFIMVFGFVMIYSASYYTAGMSKAYNNDPMYLLKNQIIYSMLGIIAMLVVASINYHFWCRFATIGYIACIGLIFLLKTPLGVTVKGATRWIRIAGVQVSGGGACEAHYDCIHGNADCGEGTAPERLDSHVPPSDSERHYRSDALEDQ